MGQVRLQKTIARIGSLSGIGVHSGKQCTVSFGPAPVNSGIEFTRKGTQVARLVSGSGRHFSVLEKSRCTAIGKDGHEIQTVEHLMAALFGLGISNIKIDVEGIEIPALDGSALPFVHFFKELGLVDQSQSQPVYKIKAPIFCGRPGRALAIYPAEEFSVAYVLDYGQTPPGTQRVDFHLTPNTFETEIAPARTFCTVKDSQTLREKGLGLGANYENTLVISEQGVLQNTLRYNDEFARHKVLDLIGDLSLLGFCIAGRVIGLRSGHLLNHELVDKISAQII